MIVLLLKTVPVVVHQALTLWICARTADRSDHLSSRNLAHLRPLPTPSSARRRDARRRDARRRDARRRDARRRDARRSLHARSNDDSRRDARRLMESGNRTRLLQYPYRASTGVVSLAFSQSRISYKLPRQTLRRAV